MMRLEILYDLIICQTVFELTSDALEMEQMIEYLQKSLSLYEALQVFVLILCFFIKRDECFITKERVLSPIYDSITKC